MITYSVIIIYLNISISRLNSPIVAYKYSCFLRHSVCHSMYKAYQLSIVKTVAVHPRGARVGCSVVQFTGNHLLRRIDAIP